MRFSRIPVSIVVAGASLLIVMAGAVVFGASDQARRLADSALELSKSERVLTAASVMRSDLGITITLIEAGNAKLATGESAAEALVSAGAASRAFMEQATEIDRMSTALDFGAELPVVQRDWERVRTAGEHASVDELEANTDALLRSVQAITDQVVDRRQVLANEVAAEGGSAGDLARVASFTVALIGPALALWGYRSISRNRLERVRREEELRRREEVASAKEGLIAGLSHELRTPLTAITGFAATIMETLHGPPSPEERDLIRELSGTVHSQSNELSRMVEDLLATMRLGDGLMSTLPSPVKITRAVDTAVAGFGDDGWIVHMELEEASIAADPLQLRHVLRNLLSNAIRHGDGRRIVRGEILDDVYTLEIVDHGAGLPEGVDPGATFAHGGYDPLVTGSVGMGLSVAYNLAALMNTEIRYQRIDGQTVFSLDFPVAQPKTISDVDRERRESEDSTGSRPLSEVSPGLS